MPNIPQDDHMRFNLNLESQGVVPRDQNWSNSISSSVLKRLT